MDKVNCAAWIGRSETLSGVVSDQLAAQVHATLGKACVDAPSTGDVLPPLWHWYAFPPKDPMRVLGSDGHPKLGGFLPPMELSRRMWAGGRLDFHAPLHVGERLTRQSSILAVEEKAGSSGPMAFVTVEHQIRGVSGIAITEVQNIVYLDIPDQFRAPKLVAAPVEPDIDENVDVTETLLFRYSAVTFNAHRIHYDLTYTQQVEHYPGLVVHGPLQANMLIDLAKRHKRRAPDTFEFRGIHPMFCPSTMRLCAITDDPNRWTLCSVSDRHQCMTATVTWKETAHD